MSEYINEPMIRMGRAVGTTYASGFLSEADRMMILKSMQGGAYNDIIESVELVGP